MSLDLEDTYYPTRYKFLLEISMSLSQAGTVPIFTSPT